MARKAQSAEDTRAALARASKIPEGYTRGSAQLAGAWIKPSEGLVVVGRLMGRFVTKGNGKKDRPYYQIKVDAPTPAIVRQDDGEWADGEVPKGELVNLDERASVKGLAAIVATGIPHNVWVQFVGKEELDGGNTWWRIEWGHMALEESTPNN
jgi:hypothetical protein